MATKDYPNLKPWKPGQSGNLNGRPVGTRQAFSAGFFRDLAEVWAQHGRDAMLLTARTQPSTFLAIAARLYSATGRGGPTSELARQPIAKRLGRSTGTIERHPIGLARRR